MDPLQIYLVTQVFNYTIDQLKVTNKGRYTPNEMEVNEPCEIRFQSKMHESVYQQLNPFRPSEEAMNEQEVEEETNSFITLLIEVMDEIRVKGTFEVLLQMIQDQIDEAADEDNLVDDHMQIHKKFDEIKYKLRHHDSKANQDTHARDDLLRELKAELMNIKVVNAVELNLVNSWEDTRYDQGMLYYKNTERNLLNDLRYYDMKIKQEENAIENIERFYEEKIEDLRQRLKQWTQKYECDIEEHDKKIRELKTAINKIKSDEEEKQKTFEEEKKFIEEYKAQRAIEEAEMKEEKKLVESTIVIQSWWRGTMVRQNLGPYKKKKKSKRGRRGK